MLMQSTTDCGSESTAMYGFACALWVCFCCFFLYLLQKSKKPYSSMSQCVSTNESLLGHVIPPYWSL